MEKDAKKTAVTSFCSKPLFKSDLVIVLRKANKIELPEEVKEEAVNLTGKHIFLVEDILLKQKLVMVFFEEKGAEVRLTKHGQEVV